MSVRYLSVCSGIEAATAAWHPLGFIAAGFAEIEKFPSKVLAHHYGSNMPGEELSRNGVPNHGDFTTIDVSTLGQVDILVGGTPCQAFSVAGKRLSLADARGNLSLAYAVLMHELARSNGLSGAVWENVPGVLNTKDNAFGCLLGALVGHDRAIDAPRGGKWNDAGMVAGPWARAAWIVRDAQYFGLAQRRRRVFVVVSVGDRIDPAAVLFERQGLHRHPPSRGEAGQGFAHDLAQSLTASGRGVERTGETRGQDPVVAVAYGGGNRSGSVEVAACLVAKGQKFDFEVETFIAQGLRGESFDASEDGSGPGTPLVPVCFDPRQTDVLVRGDMSGPLDTKFPGPAIAFQGRGSNIDLGQDVTGTIGCNADRASGGAPCVAFSCKDHGQDTGADLSPTLRAMQGEHANAGGQVAVATAWAVRRLTPVECHRLQGFPDDHCAIPGAADGPIYKALGNSMAVPCMAWIGRRIAEQMRACA